MVVVDRYGFVDTLAEFDRRESAERFASKVRELDPEADLRIVEVRGYEITSVVVVSLVVGLLLAPALVALLRGTRGVVQG